MKFIEDEMTLELTRRNLELLLEKLDDPNSAKTLISPTGNFAVRAVENDVHYSHRSPGVAYMPSKGEYK